MKKNTKKGPPSPKFSDNPKYKPQKNSAKTPRTPSGFPTTVYLQYVSNQQITNHFNVIQQLFYQIVVQVSEDGRNVEGEAWAFVDLHEPEPGPGRPAGNRAGFSPDDSGRLEFLFNFYYILFQILIRHWMNWSNNIG